MIIGAISQFLKNQGVVLLGPLYPITLSPYSVPLIFQTSISARGLDYGLVGAVMSP